MKDIDGLTNQNPTFINGTSLNKMDLISSVFLERGNMLDGEVRRIIYEIEQSNELIYSINTLQLKASLQAGNATNKSLTYDQVTWLVEDKMEDGTQNIVLSNTYKLSLRKTADNENFFVLADSKGNQLIYQNQTLIPVPAGKTVDALNVGIPLMNNTTFVLSDGTEITLQADDPDVVYNPETGAGGQANATTILISRGNQALRINNFDAINVDPTIDGPQINEDDVRTTLALTNPSHIQTHTAYVKPNNTVLPAFLDPGLKDLDVKLLNYAHSLSDAEQEALVEKFRTGGGFKLDWQATGTVTSVERADINNTIITSDTVNVNVNRQNTYTPNPTETLQAFFTRIGPQLLTDFQTDATNALPNNNIPSTLNGLPTTITKTSHLTSLSVDINFPQYTYDKEMSLVEYEVIKNNRYNRGQPNDILTDTQGDNNTSSVDEAYTYHSEETLTTLETFLTKTADYRQEGLLKTLNKDGLDIEWNITDPIGTFAYTHKTFPNPQESLEDFLLRAQAESTNLIKQQFQDFTGSFGSPNMQIESKIMIPQYEYLPNIANIPSHPWEISINDGHVLREANGLNQWEYDGSLTDNIQGNNSRESFIKKKEIFSASITNQYFPQNQGGVFLTTQERNMLRTTLGIAFEDKSDQGFLTEEEWVLLSEHLKNAKENLIGSSQIQNVQLQRALISHNANFDLMSNSINRLYTLLKSIFTKS